MNSITYKNSGVNTDQAEHILDSFSLFLKSRPKDARLLSGIGPYASCFSLKETLNLFEDPLLVSCCDGVGTKGKLALDWNHIDRLGEDLVAMNVNDLLCVGAVPLVFLDYYACGKLEKFQLLTLLKSIQLGCEMAECSLSGGETAEMPGLYLEKDFDLAGFSVGLVDRKNVLGESRVKVKDCLIAIESSGLHSNGYSLIRKLVEKEKLNPESKTSFSERTWAEELLSPTLIYVKALKIHLTNLTGLAHITGGGITGNLPRILPAGSEAHLKLDTLKFSELFKWIQNSAALSTEQMLETFNCGTGMIAACDPSYAETLLTSLAKGGLKGHVMGSVENSSSGSEKSDPLILWQ
ncbi:MAG: phosphoribosylformylglycinamidine cyclo-ligase [Proteobacteria bacterium]|nr:phosphoribosylformylglycinamidine cyclo-ligase [Pseudomonadota bacterium]